MKHGNLSALIAAAALSLGAHAQTLTLPQQPPGTTPSVIPEPPRDVSRPSVDPILKPRAGATAKGDASVSVKSGKDEVRSNNSAHGQAASNGPKRASAGSESNASAGANRAGAGTEVEADRR